MGPRQTRVMNSARRAWRRGDKGVDSSLAEFSGNLTGRLAWSSQPGLGLGLVETLRTGVIRSIVESYPQSFPLHFWHRGRRVLAPVAAVEMHDKRSAKFNFPL